MYGHVQHWGDKMRILLVTFLAFAVVRGGVAKGDMPCPPMPDAVTTIAHDVKSDIDASVGSLGKLKVGQIGVKTDVVAKSIFEKYPNLDRLLTLQTMAATYCALLRESTLSDGEKLNRWEAFQTKALDLKEQAGTGRIGAAVPKIQHEPAGPTPPSTKETSPSIRFLVRDTLSSEQKSEALTLYINGNSVGTLALDRNAPAKSIVGTVSREGIYSYAIVGFGDVIEGSGVRRVSAVGQGTLDISSGKVFSVGVKRSTESTVELVLNPQ
jgi:hypothetical protein